MGRIVDIKGTRADPDKIATVQALPAPENINQLRSYLGAVTYYSQFIPTMRKLRAPMDNLLRKDVKWFWSKSCQEYFDGFKSALSETTTLVHYNPNISITVAADASNDGLGACLYDTFSNGNRKPISHASRALMQAEKNYSQIEKEGLALIFAVKKFHRFIYGRKFQLETDHKPLLSIFGSKKGLPTYTANRLQRWALTLLNYNFDIIYTSTNSFGHADILSRLINKTEKEPEDYIIACIKCDAEILEEAIEKLPLKFEQIKSATQNCNDLNLIKLFLQNGWPDEYKIKESANKLLTQFFYRKDNLLIIQECLFFGERIVVPSFLQKKVLNQLHEGHPGISRMTQLARNYVYWPNIDAHIKQFVQTCTKCALAAKAPVKGKKK